MLTLSEAVRVADSLRRGSLAVLPTETGYMLAALATSVTAIERAFAVKQRDRAQVMHVACASMAMAASVGVLTPAAVRLLGSLTPGPLSVVVAKTPLLPDTLVAVNGTVGIRVPDHPATLQVIAEVGAPLTATSLNVSGAGPTAIADIDLGQLNWPREEIIYVILDDDAIAYEAPSTLVRVTGAELEILRTGPVSEETIRKIAGTGNRLTAAQAAER